MYRKIEQGFNSSEETAEDEINIENQESIEDGGREESVQFQEQKQTERWSAFMKSIVEKDFGSEKLQNDLSWLGERLQKSKEVNEGKGGGGWRSLMTELASDEIIGDVVDMYCQDETLQSIHGAEISEADLEILQNIADENQVPESRLQFLEKLLDTTSKQTEQNKSGEMSQEIKITAAIWSEVLARFQKIRLEKMRERMEGLLPVIEEQKARIVEFYTEKYGEFVSQEALKRVEDIQVWIGDEYLESGTDWRLAGSYNAQPGQEAIFVSGKNSMDESAFTKVLQHELAHVISGHGEQEQLSGAEDGQDLRRVGIHEYGWINEVMTERLVKERFEDRQESYPAESAVWGAVQNAHGVSEEDILKWYFVEGDDSEIKAELDEKYPGLFTTLENIKKEQKGGKVLENIEDPEDMESLVNAIYSGKGVNQIKEKMDEEKRVGLEQRLDNMRQDLEKGQEEIRLRSSELSKREDITGSEKIKKVSKLKGLYKQIDTERVQDFVKGGDYSRIQRQETEASLEEAFKGLQESIAIHHALIEHMPQGFVENLENNCKRFTELQMISASNQDGYQGQFEKRVKSIPSPEEVMDNREDATDRLIKAGILDPEGDLS